MGNDPKSFVIFPDPLVNKGNITAVTGESNVTTGLVEEGSTAGPAPGAVAPKASNKGNMIASHSGTLSTTNASNLDYYFTRAGGLYSNSEWAWKKNTENEFAYTGTSDIRFLHHHNDIFGDAGLAVDTVAPEYCIMSSKKYSKLMAFRLKGVDTVEIASRGYDDGYTTWTSSSISLSPIGTYRGRKQYPAEASIDAVELEDGTILLFMEYIRTRNINQAPEGTPAARPLEGDICIWSSSDGGSTWDLAVDEIVALYGPATTGVSASLLCIKVAVDGDWIRMVTSEDNGSASPFHMTLNTYVSSDRGATWKLLSKIEGGAYDHVACGVTADVDGSTYSPHSLDLYHNYSVTGTGRGDGSFMLFYSMGDGSSAPENTLLKAVNASCDAEWSISVNLNGRFSVFGSLSTLYISQMDSCAGSSHIYLIVESSYSDGPNPVVSTYDFIRGMIIPKDTYADSSTYVCWGNDIEGSNNVGAELSTRNYGLGYLRLAWAGNCVFMAHGILNRVAGGACASNTPYVGSMFGWFSKRPMRRYNTFFLPFYDEFFQHSYAVDMGAYPTSLTQSPWENLNLGGGDTAPSASLGIHTSMTLSAAPGLQQGVAYYYITTAFENLPTPFGTTNGSFMDHGVMGCVMKITNPNLLESTAYGTIVMAARTFSEFHTTTPKRTMVGVGFNDDNKLIVSEGWQTPTGNGGWSTLYTSPSSAIDWTYHHEVRLALSFAEDELSGSGPQCEVSFCRVGAYDVWHSSGILSLDGTAPHMNMNDADFQPTTLLSKVYQTYYFGTIASTASTSTLPTTGSVQISWKSMYISEQEDMRQFGYISPELTFGQPASPDPVYVHGGHYVSWGGGGAIYGDQYNSEVRFSYGIENAMAPSPNMVWKTPAPAGYDYAPQISQNRFIVFDADMSKGDGGDEGARFFPDSLALYNTQTRVISVEWSNSSTFASVGASVQVDTMLHTDLTITIATTTSTGTSRVVRLASVYTSGGATYDFADHQLAGKFLQLQTAPNVGRSYKIIRNVGQYLYIESDSASAAFILVGATAIIYDNKAIGSVSSTPIDVYRYMRIVFSGLGVNGTGPRGQHSLGAIVIGEKFEMNVPFDWENSDTEKGTVTVLDLAGGGRIANRLGPPRRTFTASIAGDMEGQTVNLKRCLRTLTHFNQKPVALVLDPDDLVSDDKQMYCRFGGQVDSKSLAWYRDSDSVWRRTSEITLTFEEEV